MNTTLEIPLSYTDGKPDIEGTARIALTKLMGLKIAVHTSVLSATREAIEKAAKTGAKGVRLTFGVTKVEVIK